MDLCFPVFHTIRITPLILRTLGSSLFFAFICLCFYHNCPVDNAIGSLILIRCKVIYPVDSTVIQSRFEQPRPDTLLVIHKTVLIFKSLCKLASMYLEDFFNELSTNYNLRNPCCNSTLPKTRSNY